MKVFDINKGLTLEERANNITARLEKSSEEYENKNYSESLEQIKYALHLISSSKSLKSVMANNYPKLISRIFYEKATSLWMINKPESAKKAILSAIHFSEEPFYYYNLGQMYSDLNDTKSAEKNWQVMKEKFPMEVYTYLMQSICAIDNGEYEHAVKILNFAKLKSDDKPTLEHIDFLLEATKKQLNSK